MAHKLYHVVALTAPYKKFPRGSELHFYATTNNAIQAIQYINGIEGYESKVITSILFEEVIKDYTFPSEFKL